MEGERTTAERREEATTDNVDTFTRYEVEENVGLIFAEDDDDGASVEEKFDWAARVWFRNRSRGMVGIRQR